MTFSTYKNPDWPKLEEEILKKWKHEHVFMKSIESKDEDNTWIFYEGPPSANGLPGIHHVMSRTIKDVFCRFKSMQGFRVLRKGGWDTHGLPVELQVEKRLGITREDIGVKVSVEDYNAECKKDVMKFKEKWDELTERTAFWLDLENPYITYENNYIETLWYILSKFHEKGFLYKGYTIQPYSPAAGTGLSSHELNQPGCYKEVTDTTAVAQFELLPDSKSQVNKLVFSKLDENLPLYFLAWTTTPWTLPSNTALAVGSKIDYKLVLTRNPYTGTVQYVILAGDLFDNYFQSVEIDSEWEKEFEGINDSSEKLTLLESKSKNSKKPVGIQIQTILGKDLKGLKYIQLLSYDANKIEGQKAFEVVLADFVTTQDGTGIVHIAPSFGADDFRIGQKEGLASLTMVDKQGKFIDGMGELSGKYVKNYTDEDENHPDYKSTDVLIAIKLKEENKAFKVEKYNHNYPHCWRTDKPILYYPLESWFVKTTAVKDKLVRLNNEINWIPKSTGEGRFGNWLENLVDWNLSRSRYWGTPLPIWVSEDGTEQICIGSVQQLQDEIKKSIDAGFMDESPFKNKIDLHKPFVDKIILCSSKGQKMHREPDLIDVWFDSGAMPYAQWHWPFENKIEFEQNYPADFIAEGVDQTRGWFFTLHTIAAILDECDEEIKSLNKKKGNPGIAYRNVLANGLVLDKNGNKMSKRLGNAVEPFKAVEEFGSDAIRWYMLSNASPWDNLKFDLTGVDETKRKFFGTLYNTYSFFALYANVDKWEYKDDKHKESSISERPEIDRWIISLLNTLIEDVTEAMEEFDPTKATRAIQDFVTEDLSNWYVRLNRRRFWKGEMSEDKDLAYTTLYECLLTVSKLMAPFAPFYADKLYTDLTVTSNKKFTSVHLDSFPESNFTTINKPLEQQMNLAQKASSLVLSLRKKSNIKVRQPLQKIMIPANNEEMKDHISKIKSLILGEVNVKELEILATDNQIIVKQIKPDFRILGKKVGSLMKQVASKIQDFDSGQIARFETEGKMPVMIDNREIELVLEDVEITPIDIPGWLVVSEDGLTVALDIEISPELKKEGIAREFVNKVQNLRKETGLDVTDRIIVKIMTINEIWEAISEYKDYICAEILANELDLADELVDYHSFDLDGSVCQITINKV
jgi:isoleucyl-tRNA synthetase